MEAAKAELNLVSWDLDGMPWSGDIATSAEFTGPVAGGQVWDAQMLFQVDAAQKDGIAMLHLSFPFFAGNDTGFVLTHWTEAYGLSFSKGEKGRGELFKNHDLNVHLVKRWRENPVRDAQGRDRLEKQFQIEAEFAGTMRCEDSGRTVKITNGRYLGRWLREINSGTEGPRRDR